MLVSAESFRNRPIVGSDGLQLGEVIRIFLDSDDLRVVSVEARVRNDVADQLGVSRSIFRAGTLEIPVEFLKATADNVVLTLSLGELRRTLATDRPDASH